jgi:stearoyl-CoA desaturase (delta-9 desaturase)
VYILLAFFVTHWALSIFFQTFFLHRYVSHRMFTMSPRWERFFYLGTALTQGSSFLIPRGYAILHREHHAYSDTPDDPHSPHHAKNVVDMMVKTAVRYEGLCSRRITPEPRFDGDTPEWPLVDRVFNAWPTRLTIGTLYTLPYLVLAPHWAFFLLVPIHYVMGPVHGAIVNWCGHMYGYQNFDNNDKSRNSLIFDVIMLGELFQNNHHKLPKRVNFAAKWFEFDPTYPIIKALSWVRIIKINPQYLSSHNRALA